MDALDAAFGSTERSVGDAHALAFGKRGFGVAEIVEACLARRGDEHEDVHLAVGNGVGSAPALAVGGGTGVEDGALRKAGLHVEGAAAGGAEKHQGVDYGPAHVAPLSVALNDGGLCGHVALDAVGCQLFLYSKHFVVEHLQGVPMKLIVVSPVYSHRDIVSIPAHRGFVQPTAHSKSG